MEKAKQTETVPVYGGIRWLYLAAGCLLLLLLGLIYAWSVFISPLETEFGWNRAETSLTFTISIVLFCAGGIAGGVLTRKISPKWVLAAAAVFIAAGFGLASRITSLLGIYLAYGVLAGFGVGLAYNALIGMVTKWFPDKKGLCSGALLMGFGVGGFLLGSIATQLMAVIGWRTMFLIFAGVFAVVLLAGALLLRPAPAIAPQQAAAQADEQQNYTPGQMLRRKSFWMYFGWSLFLTAAGLVVIGHAAAVANDLGMGASVAAVVAGIVSISNGLGRILFGMLYDRLQLKKTMRVITLCSLLAPVCLLLASLLQNLPLLCAGFLLTGAFYGGVPTMNTTFAGSYYGMRDFPVNFSLVNSNLLFAPVIGTYLAANLRVAYGSYTSSFVLMILFAVVGTIALTQVKKP